ncbi:MAG: four helix bundle protein [Acidaminococcus sp.]|jgi:four helix bundle protein|uniref:four helix bundle protein n=1 Tax=Acidaminococcus sp. TaxID=1872103 RepID=UPI003F140BC9
MNYSYKNLSVWQRAMDLALLIYQLTEAFPKSEMYGLANQMRRAAVSIASNIAEGRSRGTDKDFIYFLYISRGSCTELETQLLLSERVGYLDLKSREEACEVCDEVNRKLSKLIRSIQSK